MIRIVNVVGARPNFMKIAPLMEEMRKHPEEIDPVLVHTGQHYDQKMSKAFFDDLGMPKPDIDLEVGSGTHAEQTGRVMIAFERVCEEFEPDLVLVVGDVNSTLACALTAKKLGIQVAHVEAGLRSRDMGMPEELNRLCTDVLCDYLFTTDRIADANLIREGIPKERIHFVGNVMIDTLLKHRARATNTDTLERLGLRPRVYGVVTLHRPTNVDDRETLEGIFAALKRIAERLPLVFPVHPRTRKMIEHSGLSGFLTSQDRPRRITPIEPLGYLDFLALNMSARLILTDSGGIQEESTVLGVPCITLRDNTERPITCEMGTNVLVGSDPTAIYQAANAALQHGSDETQVPDLWDGRAAERIVKILRETHGAN